jgi:hypothetical protein
MVNVVVSRKRNVRVSSNATAGVIDTTVPVTLKNAPVLSSGLDTIDELRDVGLTQRTDGSTLIYDNITDTYQVKPLDFDNIVGDLDGGVF